MVVVAVIFGLGACGVDEPQDDERVRGKAETPDKTKLVPFPSSDAWVQCADEDCEDVAKGGIAFRLADGGLHAHLEDAADPWQRCEVWGTLEEVEAKPCHAVEAWSRLGPYAYDETTLWVKTEQGADDDYFRIGQLVVEGDKMKVNPPNEIATWYRRVTLDCDGG
jgi:hypothetical protein